MDMDFFDVSFEESLDEQLVSAILDVGRDIRRLFEGKESQSRILMILRLQGAVTQKMLIQILHIQPGSASEILKKMEKAGLIIWVPNEMNRRASDIVLLSLIHIYPVSIYLFSQHPRSLPVRYDP